MANIKTASVGLLGLVLLVAGLSLWVLGDQTSTIVSLPLASTGIQWAPLIWLLGIIVLCSAALANTMRFKHYVAWILILVVGYLAVFGVLVAVTSQLLP